MQKETINFKSKMVFPQKTVPNEKWEFLFMFVYIGSRVLMTTKNLCFFAKICAVMTQIPENNLCFYFNSFSGITQ